MLNSIKKCQIFLFLFLSLVIFSYQQDTASLSLAAKDYPEYSRIVVESSVAFRYQIEKNGSFLIIKIRADNPFRIEKSAVNSRFIKSFGWSEGSDYNTLAIKAEHSQFRYDSFRLNDPFQLVIDVIPKMVKKSEETFNERDEKAVFGEEKEAAAQSETSLQTLKTIVIDPGHGGLESGAKGKFGALEKNVTLAIGKKLKSIIERDLAFRVVLTREKDIYKSLEDRASIANNNKAYLFISIHANSSYRKKANGSETFFLNLNATDEEARRLAFLENTSGDLEERIAQGKEEDIKMILWDMAQAAYLQQSSQLAENIQNELNSLLSTKNRGIKQAPFKVLTGVACPAVLVEVAFLSNPEEERKMIDEEFQESVARAIYQGVINFLQLYSQE